MGTETSLCYHDISVETLGNEQPSHGTTWAERIPNRGKSSAKVLRLKMCLAPLKSIGQCGRRVMRVEMMGGEGEGSRGARLQGFLGCFKDFVFYSGFNRKPLEIWAKGSMHLKRIIMVAMSEKSPMGIPNRRLLYRPTSQGFVLNKQENGEKFTGKEAGDRVGSGSLLCRILNWQYLLPF